MADYAPIYLYADQITGTTSAAVTGGQALVVSGDDTVGPAGADAANFIGTAAQDAASGVRVSYHPRGKVHESTTAGAVTAGNSVFTAAAGLVDDTGTAANRIGVFLTSAVSGAKARWMEF
jgi:Uncharacterized conserved protein (DUF2190)